MRLLHLLFVLLPFTLVAQPTHRTAKGWQELTISDGLSQGMVYDLKQDPKGFIWVATKDGLNRYDGYNFTVFTHDPYNDYSLSDNNCSSLLVDSRGWLWVGTLNKGLNLFDTRTQRFYHLNIRDQALPNAGNYAINTIFEDPQGAIWVVAGEIKLFKIQLANALKNGSPDQANLTDQVQIIPVSVDGKVTDLIKQLNFRPDGQAMAISTNGLLSFNWQHPQKASTFNSFTGDFARGLTFYSDINQDALLATIDEENKVVCRQRGRQKTVLVRKDKDAVISLNALNSTTLAIARGEFLWIMSLDEFMRQDSLTVRNAFTTLPTDLYAITNLLRDRTGNIWVGTSGYGLRKFNPQIKQFQSTLPGMTLSYLYADQQGRTYVRHQFSYYQFDRLNNRTQPFLGDALPPADKRQRYLMQDRQGTFWVSNTHFQTHQMHLFKFSADWQLLKKYPLPSNTSFGFYYNQTVEDKAGKLWLGAIDGKLLRFDPKTETFRVFSYQSLLPQKGAEIETYALYFDQAGTLWIATQQGLVRADHTQTSPTFSLYKNSPTDRQSLSNDIVLSLLDDPHEPGRYLWVGTKGGGLDRLDKQTGHFTHFTEKQGLPNKVVYGILTDTFLNLWLSTNRGLAQFNPKTKQFRNFTKADGLQDDEFNTGSFFKSSSGELMFGGVNGLTTFRAADLVRKGGSTPQVHLIGLKVNNEAIDVGSPDGILTESIENTQRIDLAHDQNLITFEFGLMDYANSAKNQYRYRLDGIDEKWVSAGTNRFANYAQLPPGNYTLQMSGSVEGEHWSKPIALQVRVHPPFYRTWWAYGVYLLVLALITWQLHRIQTQRLLLQQQVVFRQQEASRLVELDTLKTQFFTNISHEFRTPLTLILGPLDNLKERFPDDSDLTLMERNGQRLLSLTNQLLDLSKLEAGQLKTEAEPGDIAAFLRTLASSFSSLADSRAIQFIFTQDQPTHWVRFDRDKVEKIITNLLSNAFKFTPDGNVVRLNVAYEPGGVILRVADTGIGIATTNLPKIFDRFYQVDSQSNRNYEGTGIGLALVNELVKVLQGTISVDSLEGKGTTFTVHLPLTPMAAPIAADNTQTPDDTSSGEASFMDGRPLPVGILPLEVPINGLVDSPVSENILLIIDDNADIRAYVRSIFETDYQIIDAIDGLDGLEKATATLPNIVICDLMMPRLDGFGFCRMLKTQEATSHIPVVMLTAKATIEDRIEGFELGADDYLTKPFNRAEIQVRVRNLIDKQERLRLHYTSSLLLHEPVSVQATSPEDAFLKKARAIVEEHLSDSRFGVEAFSKAMNLSPSQLLRKLKALTNLTVVEFLRQYRLQRAATLLAQGDETVSAIAYQVGFENLSYFTKMFQEEFGVLPSAYAET
ncbi:hybrid sensor histidine kinase/response regulator transcription factor [Spirosoma endophyticum]|uniref:histidine kinase n=1 Tax=Spirosoma endophyticum TaxID=662367 RepID=A0A1I1SLX9_9BACT|nr:hybrid sensor histidine kinase/response regulator transcription factor [Spirosoma endophyticum]SFD45688.1 Signal transduction histidine kinase [Spirosoma endophyticum]